MAAPARSVPLPGPLRLPSSLPFVGRWDQLADLASAREAASAGVRRIVLVGGEAGSGKSRIVREFARAAYDEGAVVLHGACDPVVPTPYGPFVEALEHLVRFAPPDDLRTVVGPTAGELTRVLPDLPARIGPLPAPMQADQDTERYRLSSAVSDLLSGVSSMWPVVLVLEDGHWADAPSLLLLRHVARSVDARLLVVATFRDTEAEVPAGLSDALVDLRRSDGVVRIRVGGLSDADLLDFVGRASGAHVDQAARRLAEEIARLTQGNAFLVCELWQSLVETGCVDAEGGRLRLLRPLDQLATPESVRELASQRLHRLDRATTELLELGAVAGTDFSLAAIRSATGQTDERLLHAVEQARASGMIEELPGRGLDYRFTHELVRRALYDRLPAPRRATLHLRIGEALDAAGTARASDLAHHFTAAVPLAGSERAVEHNLRAAEAAISSLAFDDAAGHLRTALELGIADDRRRSEALLALGNACRRAGAAPDAMAAYRQVAEDAREAPDGDLLARAAIGFEAASWRARTMSDVAIALLEEALALLPEQEPQRRVEVLASLVRPLGLSGRYRRSRATLDEAVAGARSLHDPTTLARTLVQAHFARGRGAPTDILDMLAEAQSLAGEVGEVEVDAQARLWRCIILIGNGDLEQARLELVSQGAAAHRARQPFLNYINEYLGSTLALCTGHLDAAAAAAERANDWGRHLRGSDVRVNHGVQMFGIRREQGRLAEVAPAVRALAREDAGGPWPAVMAAILAELGMTADAREMLSRIRAGECGRTADGTRLASTVYAADAAAAVGDAATAAQLHDELAPLAGTTLVIGQAISCYGAADRYLGMLALAAGEVQQAARHLASAVRLDRETGAATWLAHSLYQHGRVLARIHDDAAAAALAEAEGLAEAVGMPSLLARIRSVGSPQPPPAFPDGLSPREVEILRLVAGGLSNRQIGERLSISEHTAANHLRSILRKTGSGNRTQAAAYAFRQGLAADVSERRA